VVGQLHPAQHRQLGEAWWAKVNICSVALNEGNRIDTTDRLMKKVKTGRKQAYLLLVYLQKGSRRGRDFLRTT
jgi:hypothetical protein